MYKEKVTVIDIAGIAVSYRLVPDPVQYQLHYTWYTIVATNGAELGSVGRYCSNEQNENHPGWTVWSAIEGSTEQVFLMQEEAVRWIFTRFALLHYLASLLPTGEVE